MRRNETCRSHERDGMLWKACQCPVTRMCFTETWLGTIEDNGGIMDDGSMIDTSNCSNFVFVAFLLLEQAFHGSRRLTI